MNKGFVIMAQNTKLTNYVECAEVLRDSIYRVMPNANVTIITDLPHGDLDPDSNWKLINDWQVYEASPYEYTIKLEADMIIPSNIDYWWDILTQKDLVICSTIRNFKNEISDVKSYRGFVIDNELPDVYNAITYFKKSDLAKEFFYIVKDIFYNWEEYKKLLKCNRDEIVTTDWAYSLAAHIIGIESCTLPNFTQMSMVHMKKHINYLTRENWTDELVYEFTEDSFKVNTFPQCYPFHYYIKDFSKTLGKYYG
jgi:hypothetical protein